jgi:hypothetical protein
VKNVEFKFTVELKDGRKLYSYLPEHEGLANLYFGRQLVSDDRFFMLPDLIVSKDEVRYITLEIIEEKSK